MQHTDTLKIPINRGQVDIIYNAFVNNAAVVMEYCGTNYSGFPINEVVCDLHIRRMIWAKKDPEKWSFLKVFYTNQLAALYELIRNVRFFHLCISFRIV